ncbi:MAG: hypothetical protein ACE5KA_02500 [Nitrososphaerales archaeon]
MKRILPSGVIAIAEGKLRPHASSSMLTNVSASIYDVNLKVLLIKTVIKNREATFSA